MSRAFSILTLSAVLAAGLTVHAQQSGQQGTNQAAPGSTTTPRPGGASGGAGNTEGASGGTARPAQVEVSCVNAIGSGNNTQAGSAAGGTRDTTGGANTTTGGTAGGTTGGTSGGAGGASGGTGGAAGGTTGGTSGSAGGAGGTTGGATGSMGGTTGGTGGTTGGTTGGGTGAAGGTTGSPTGGTGGTAGGTGTVTGNTGARTNTLSNLNANDICFLDKAARSNIYEITSSRLALQQSQNANVKKIATQLINDHTKATQTLTQLVARFGARLPAQASAVQQTMIKTLQGQKGSTFDATYLAQQVAAHTEAINMFRQYSQQAKDPSIRQFAAQQLPALQAHLRQVQQAQSQLGKK